MTAAGNRRLGFCPDSWKASLDGVIGSGEEMGLRQPLAQSVFHS